MFAPPSTNSQSSCAGCQANFTKPALLTVAGPGGGGLVGETRPGPAPKSVTPRGVLEELALGHGAHAGPPVRARHSCSR